MTSHQNNKGCSCKGQEIVIQNIHSCARIFKGLYVESNVYKLEIAIHKDLKYDYSTLKYLQFVTIYLKIHIFM